MSIIRAERKSNFYRLPASVIEDQRLSWAARGLLVHLLSKPDNWRVNLKYLINQTQEAIGGRSGRDKVYKLINELRAAGYMYQEFVREGGNFRGVEYEVSEVPDLVQAAAYVASLEAKPGASAKPPAVQPFTDLPETVAPHTDSPVTAEPFTEKPETLDSTESSFQIEKAVSYDDPRQAGGSVGVKAPVGAKSKAHSPGEGEPSNYPQSPDAKSYAPWHAYARAYRAKHKAWPLCNKRLLSQMCLIADRVGELAPMIATYYVKHETAKHLVDALHPVSALLTNCEAYATRAQKSARFHEARATAEAVPATAPVAPEPTPAQPAVDKGPGIGLAALMKLAAERAPAEPAAAVDAPAAPARKVIPAGLAGLLAARPGPQPVRIAL
ncbi:hypothetical protein [Pseudomonas sp. GD03730]|uniref:hypothetical protein n=1 Tax=Pseudomonas sp. GD03730 TaxID=2975375 RepID=UPI002448B62A|nr:hypothetical protein [Pseudomonas sp. GD03730]MDH1403690.1 hypothetical protein [Pseudomonas sp. GD03730]